MTGLETAVLLGFIGLLILEPVRRSREWWARTRPVAPWVERFQAARDHYESIR